MKKRFPVDSFRAPKTFWYLGTIEIWVVMFCFVLLTATLIVLTTVPAMWLLFRWGLPLAVSATLVALALPIWVQMVPTFYLVRRRYLNRRFLISFRDMVAKSLAWSALVVAPPLLVSVAVWAYGLYFYPGPHKGVFLFLVPAPAGLLTTQVMFWILDIRDALLEPGGQEVVRGKPLGTALDARARLLPKRHNVWGASREATTGRCWGGLMIPQERLDPHFAVTGVPGSGKTVTIRMLMGTVLPGPKRQPQHRALVYDPKGDMYGILLGLGIAPEAIRVLHPFYEDSWAWDIAKDVQDDASAREVASILAPEDERSAHPYFSRASQDILRALILSFHEAAGAHWVLNDLVEACGTQEKLERAMGLTEEGRELYSTYFKQAPDTASNIFSTLRTKVGPYATIGRLWARTGQARMLSLSKWLTEKSVLILGSDDANRRALDPINQALFKRLSELVNSRPDTEDDETWFFLDEARTAGKLEGLLDLLGKGRSKGAHVVLGFQDIDGSRYLYGKEQAAELFGLCGNTAILRLNSPETMNWASQYLGNYEYNRESISQSYGPHGTTSGINIALAKREAILPAQFRDFPPTGPQNGLTGVFVTPHLGAWADTIAWSAVQSHLGPILNGESTRRSPEDQTRVAWTPDDYQRLGMAPSVPVKRDLRTLS